MTDNAKNRDDYLTSGKWMEEKSLADIPRTKLEFLQIMLFESKNLKQQEMLPFFMSVIKVSREKKISFSEEEMTAILEVLKAHSSEEELKRMNQIMNMRKMM